MNEYEEVAKACRDCWELLLLSINNLDTRQLHDEAWYAGYFKALEIASSMLPKVYADALIEHGAYIRGG